MDNNNRMQLMKGLIGEEGAQALEMMQRMEQLRQMLGTPQDVKSVQQEKSDMMFLGDGTVGTQEKMLSAALPYLDKAYRKDIYLLGRILELRRVMSGAGILETREGAQEEEEDAYIRQNKLLQAIRPHLSAQDQGKVDMLVKMMQVREMMHSGG